MALTAQLISTLATNWPIHMCGPKPKPKEGLGLRSMSNTSGFSKASSSRLADTTMHCTNEPLGIFTPWNSTSLAVSRTLKVATGSKRVVSSISLAIRLRSALTRSSRPGVVSNRVMTEPNMRVVVSPAAGSNERVKVMTSWSFSVRPSYSARSRRPTTSSPWLPA
ncbi:hypothetical protein D3C79_759290 [compost metagenome]